MNLDSGLSFGRCRAVFGVGFLALAAIAMPLCVAATASDAGAPIAETAKPHHGPYLAIANPVHDFGTVPQGEPIRHEFQMTNSGDEVLEILDVKPSCGCTTAGDWTRSLKPGESGVIPLKLETAHFVGGITKTITVKSNDPTQPEKVLELKAAVWTPIKISNPVLIFPALTNPNEAVTRSVTIRHEVEGKLTLTDLHSENPLFKPELKEIVPGKEFELTVTTVPPLPDGTQTGRITMKSSNPKMPDLSVQAVATVLPAMQIAPTELMFSTSKLTAAEKRFAVVLNHRGANLQVSDLTTNAPGVELTMNTTADQKQTTITLTFPAGFEIDKESHFWIRGKTNQERMPVFQIPIVYAGDR